MESGDEEDTPDQSDNESLSNVSTYLEVILFNALLLPCGTTVCVVIFEVYYISLISRASLIHRNYYYALLYFITHENFKIRTKTKNHENLLPRKLRRVRYLFLIILFLIPASSLPTKRRSKKALH